MVFPRAYGSLLNGESVSPRIMVAKFDGNPKTAIVSCYSPTSCSDEKESVQFHSMLQDVIRQLPKHNVIVIAGDVNTQVGSEDKVGFSFHDNTNRKGSLLWDLTKECELVSISTKFQKNKGKLGTHPYPNAERAQFDHILINKKWKNSAMDCQSYNTMCSVQSDHRPCSAKIRLSLRTCQMLKTKLLFVCWLLSVPATCECISGTDLLRQFYVLPH